MTEVFFSELKNLKLATIYNPEYFVTESNWYNIEPKFQDYKGSGTYVAEVDNQNLKLKLHLSGSFLEKWKILKIANSKKTYFDYEEIGKKDKETRKFILKNPDVLYVQVSCYQVKKIIE